MKISRHPEGLTVAELKAILASIPDTKNDGEPYTVWIETGRGLSSEVKEVWPLDVDGYGQDILLAADIFREPDDERSDSDSNS